EMEESRGVVQVVVVIALYWTVSISMVFVNKYILGGRFGNEDLSIFVAWYQSLSAIGFIQLLHVGSKMMRLNVPVPKIDLHVLLHADVLKLSLSFILSLTFNNLMLKHIDVAFYQVARSFTLIFTVILSSMMLKKPVTYRGMLACLLVICGFFIGIDQENGSGTLKVWGIVYGILASLSAAVCGIYFKQAEMACDRESLKQAYYNNINSCVMFMPLVFSTGQLHQVLASDNSTTVIFWIFLTISGFLSLTIGWVSALQIKFTSPVTHHISINAKSVMQTLIAVIFNNEPKTLMWWFGNLLVVTGLGLYAYSKFIENSSSLPTVQLDIKKNENGMVKSSRE
ncbi:hypothetical protein FSP39_013449, partial [Pinctada imbricata]